MNATILSVAVILTSVFAAALAWALRTGKDPFSPWAIVPGLHLIRTSPYLFLLAYDPLYAHPRIGETFPDLDSAYLWYGLVELIGFVSLYAGLGSRVGPWLAANAPTLLRRR